MRISRLCVVAILGIVFFSACAASAPSDQTMMNMPDYVKNAPASVQEAYQFAVTHPHDLETVPCYCGCGNMGHQSNLNCYVKDISADGKVTYDSHASGCGICVDITKDVMRMKQEGKSAAQIRGYIDATYSAYGPSTNTIKPAG